MDETKATASLPGLDIELKRRVDEADGTEHVSISLRAVPSIHAFGAALPFLNPFAAQMALWQGWVDMAQAFWQPFLPRATETLRLSKRD